MLKHSAENGYVRASYALGLALRDSQPDEANRHMKDAADRRYIPALAELLPAREMKAKYGEPKADELRLHLDPLCLNRLLSRYYVECAELREKHTSHCWNPLCGRWAFKATITAGSAANNNNNNNNNHHHNNDDDAARRQGFNFRNPPSRSDSALSSDSVGTARSDGTVASSSSKKHADVRVSRMKMCSRCCRAKYCSKLCQVYDWRSGRHKMECQFL